MLATQTLEVLLPAEVSCHAKLEYTTFSPGFRSINDPNNRGVLPQAESDSGSVDRAMNREDGLVEPVGRMKTGISTLIS